MLLPKIAWALSGGKGDQKEIVGILHREFKEYFCVKTTADFTNGRFMAYLSAILMIMARERGLLIPFYNEPDDIQDFTMEEWFKLQKFIETGKTKN